MVGVAVTVAVGQVRGGAFDGNEYQGSCFAALTAPDCFYTIRYEILCFLLNNDIVKTSSGSNPSRHPLPLVGVG